MKTYKPIHLLIRKGTNFTPSALMRRWGKEHNKACGNGYHFEQFLVIDGKRYVYDHYEICAYLKDKAYDMVTLYLTEKD